MDVSAELHTLAVDAYTTVLRAFAATGLDMNKEQVLATLRTELNMAHEAHYEILNQVMLDPDLQAIKAAYTKIGPGGIRKLDTATVARLSSRALSTAQARRNSTVPDTAAPIQRRPTARGGRRGPDGSGADVLPEGHSVIGRKVWRYWPNEGDNGWVKGIITDYKDATGEHVIAYDLNTSKQSYEYYNFRLANPEEYEVVMNEPPLDMATLRGSGAAPSSRALTQKKKPPAARGVGIVQLTHSGTGMDRAPFDKLTFTNALSTAPADVLQTMAVQLDRRERDVREEIAAIEDEDRDPVERLERQMLRLNARESVVRAELMACGE